MKKMIVGVVLLLLATVGFQMFRTNLSKLDRDMVYEYYQNNINATRRFDAKKLCAMYHQNYCLTSPVGRSWNVDPSMDRLRWPADR